ncbi:unnamed protein product [Ectocarpus sp. 12 AP-2014]
MTMADRVVVMRNGVIEQAAEPIVLYERPANLFVADFIGSPSMNVFKAAIEDGAVKLGKQTLPLPPEEAARLGDRKQVMFGIRPEHMRESAHTATLTIDPVVIEPLGAHTLVLGTMNGEKVTAQVDPRFDVTVNESCPITVDMTQAHFFDPQTEQRL